MSFIRNLEFEPVLARDRNVFYARALLHNHRLDMRLLVHMMLERRERLHERKRKNKYAFAFLWKPSRTANYFLIII